MAEEVKDKPETSFEELLQQRIQETILKQAGECRLIEYHHSRKKHLPDDIVEQVWNTLDWDEIIRYVSKELQDRICQTIVQNMLTEVKTDVKAILSIEGVRKKIRAEAYPKIKEIIGLD